MADSGTRVVPVRLYVSDYCRRVGRKIGAAQGCDTVGLRASLAYQYSHWHTGME